MTQVCCHPQNSGCSAQRIVSLCYARAKQGQTAVTGGRHVESKHNRQVWPQCVFAHLPPGGWPAGASSGPCHCWGAGAACHRCELDHQCSVVDCLQAKAARKRRELQRQVLFSDPLQPTAGQAVDVYYNPDATVLRGRPDVWLRGGWNRLVAVSTTCNSSVTLLQLGQHARNSGPPALSALSMSPGRHLHATPAWPQLLLALVPSCALRSCAEPLSIRADCMAAQGQALWEPSLRCRWNLDAHIAPQQLQPVVPGGVGFLKATVQVCSLGHLYTCSIS